MATEFHDMAPLPSSLIESLRDIGYSMKTAIADVIDNSITAQATRIDINFAWENDEPWIAVTDNGCGMSERELIIAMRLGSQNPLETRTDSDLGRFGLGLKTASFSQCRQLTVICRHQEKITGMEWDLDAVASNPDDGWKLATFTARRIYEDVLLDQLINDWLPGKSGTLILWRKIDRIDGSSNRKTIEKKLNSLIRDVRKHIEITFHRYLESERGRGKLSIWINNDRLEPLNPFNPAAPATQELPEQRIQLDGEHIVVKAYVLPHHSKVSRSEYEKYAGESGYLHNQGFYVYRNRRLIIKGTWFRLIPKTELTKLIRVRVDIPNSLDHLWKIDVRKSNASPPIDVRKKLKEIIRRISESGKTVFRRRGRILLEKTKTPTWTRSIVKGQVRYSVNDDYPLLLQLKDNLSDSERKLLEMYISTLESGFPADSYFNDFAGCPEKMEKTGLPAEKLDQILNIFLVSNEEADLAQEESISAIISTEPFSSQPEMTRDLLRKRGLIDD